LVGTVIEKLLVTLKGIDSTKFKFTRRMKMNRLKSIASIAVLTLIVSSTCLAGNIVGARASRTGTIVGARTGNIAGTRTGNIAGTSISSRTNGVQSRSELDMLIYENFAGIFRLLIESPLF
jgi:hypothetical protein